MTEPESTDARLANVEEQVRLLTKDRSVIRVIMFALLLAFVVLFLFVLNKEKGDFKKALPYFIPGPWVKLIP